MAKPIKLINKTKTIFSHKKINSLDLIVIVESETVALNQSITIFLQGLHQFFYKGMFEFPFKIVKIFLTLQRGVVPFLVFRGREKQIESVQILDKFGFWGFFSLILFVQVVDLKPCSTFKIILIKQS